MLQTLWSTSVALAISMPVRLTLVPQGSLQLTDAAGSTLWSSKTKGIGVPPHALQVINCSSQLQHLSTPPGVTATSGNAAGGAACCGAKIGRF
jgi:hypothetical protein